MGGLTASQICDLSRQAAKCPGYVTQSGAFLNMILADLCQTYDFQVARRTYFFNLPTGAVAIAGSSVYGSGPIDMPADFLRVQDDAGFFYTISGVQYPLIPCDLSEFDMQVQQAGLQSYPAIAAIDMSPLDAIQQGAAAPGNPQAYIWPPPSGAFPATLRYYCQMPDIDTPETSDVVPWFPNQTYLQTRLTGELMKLSDDDRWEAMLSDEEHGAQGILNRYLKLKDNKSDRATTVSLDRRRFGGGQWSRLPNTKTIGW